MKCDSALMNGMEIQEEENARYVTRRVTATIVDITLRVMKCDSALMNGMEIQEEQNAGFVTRRVTATIVDITLRVMSCDSYAADTNNGTPMQNLWSRTSE